MTHTIPHPAPPLEDARIAVARQALAELPDASDNERPYFWLGRLTTTLRDLVAIAAPGGLDNGQRELVGRALADAISYRTPEGFCRDCETHPAGLCEDHAADLDLTDAYLALARELHVEVDQ
jgi:hypothetical protein